MKNLHISEKSCNFARDLRTKGSSFGNRAMIPFDKSVCSPSKNRAQTAETETINKVVRKVQRQTTKYRPDKQNNKNTPKKSGIVYGGQQVSRK